MNAIPPMMTNKMAKKRYEPLQEIPNTVFTEIMATKIGHPAIGGSIVYEIKSVMMLIAIK
jgi:hypothetical protein